MTRSPVRSFPALALAVVVLLACAATPAHAVPSGVGDCAPAKVDAGRLATALLDGAGGSGSVLPRVVGVWPWLGQPLPPGERVVSALSDRFAPRAPPTPPDGAA